MKHFLRVMLLMVFALAVCTGALAQSENKYEFEQETGTNLIEQLLLQRNADGTLEPVPPTDTEQFFPAVYKDDSYAATENLIPFQPSADSYSWNGVDVDGVTSITYTLVSGNAKLWDSSKIFGAMDKMVFVKNVYSQDIAFRTVVAFPKPKAPYAVSDWDDKVLEHFNTTDYTSFWVPDVTIDNLCYDLLVMQYKSTLAPKTIAPPSLLQIALNKNVTNNDLRGLSKYKLMIKTEAFAISNDGEKLEPLGVYPISQTQHPWSPPN